MVYQPLRLQPQQTAKTKFSLHSKRLAVYTKTPPIVQSSINTRTSHNNVTSLVCSGDQAFVGTMSGIMRITGNNAYYISPVSTTKMLVSGGKLWVASSQGLFQFDLQGRLLKRWDVNSGLYSVTLKRWQPAKTASMFTMGRTSYV